MRGRSVPEVATTPDALQVAREALAVIEARGTCTDIGLVTLEGAVGGRTPGTMVLGRYYAVSYTDHVDRACFMFWPGADFRDECKALYVVNGAGMYVGGWQGTAKPSSHARADDGYVILHPIYPGAELLPRRAYVLWSSGRL